MMGGLFYFWVGFVADGALMIGSVQDAVGIAKE